METKYKCFQCNYFTSKKYDFNRHNNTKKHLNSVLNNRVLNINDFGFETFEHIDDKLMLNFIKYPYGMLYLFFRKLHFGNRKNRNIEMRRKNDKYIYIYKNNKWEQKNKDELLQFLINKYLIQFDIFSIINKDKISNVHIKNFNNFKENFKLSKVYNKIKLEYELILLNFMKNKAHHL